MDDYKPWIEEFVGLFLDSTYRSKATFGLDAESAAAVREFPLLQSYSFAPAEMLAGKIDEQGWAPWRPLPSPIDDELIDGFERFLGIRIPQIFRAYLTHMSLLGVNLYCGALPDIDPRYPLQWLEWCVIRRRMPLFKAKPWLIPFAEGPVAVSALCLDTRRPDGRGDYPVVRVPSRYEEVASPYEDFEADYTVFPSCAAYFEFLREWLVYQARGVPWKELPFPEWLEQRGARMPPETYYDEESEEYDEESEEGTA
jgi:hypothetical protein